MHKVPDFLNVDSCETLLASLPSSGDPIHLDASLLEWCSPHTLATLATFLATRPPGASSTFALPRVPSSAAYFLSAVRAHRALEALSVNCTNQGEHVRYRPGRLAQLELFSSRDSVAAFLRTYLDELAGSPARSLLNEQIVTTSTLSEVILRELLDNCFEHSGSSQALLISADRDAPSEGPRRNHPFLASFDRSPYVEVSVADFGPRNIIETLKSSVPSDWVPDATGVSSRSPRWLKTILYAFEFDSTRDRQRRQDRIRQILDGGAHSAPSVATGLYELSRSCRAFGGQILVRVEKFLVSVDYSQDEKSDRPVVTPYRSDRPGTLRELPGTIVTVRIPTHARYSSRALGRQQPLSRERPRRTVGRTSQIDAIPAPLEWSTDSALELLTKTGEALARAGPGAREAQPVVVLAEGVASETKILGVFISLLVQLPRGGRPLVLSCARQPALEGLNQIALIARNPSLVVLDPRGSPAIVGADDQVHSTVLTNAGDIAIRDAAAGFSLQELIQEARRRLLESALVSGARHSNTLFLIERAYYTSVYYEPTYLVRDRRHQPMLAHWLKTEIVRRNPGIVVVASEWLRETVEALRTTEQLDFQSHVLRVDTRLQVSLFCSTDPQRTRGITLLVDVICTARLVKDFIATLPKDIRVTVLAIVDARPDGKDFLPISTANGTIDIRIVSIRQEQIEPFLTRPFGVDTSSIALIDPVTLAPRMRRLSPEDALPTNEALSIAASTGGLTVGHTSKLGRHYVYYLDFRRFFIALGDRLTAWFADQYTNLEKDLSANPLKIVCLDDDTGLIQLLKRELASRAKVEAITRQTLETPAGLATVKQPGLWFVIPAIASGHTVQQCLEYAAATGAKCVHISIVVSRLDDSTGRFYGELTGYRDITVRIRWHTSIPLRSFAPERCPICRVSARLSGLELRAQVSYPQLYRSLYLVGRSLAPTEFDEALNIPSDLRADMEPSLEATLRTEYERAGTEVQSRYSLRARLTSNKRARVEFVKAIGREAVFSTDSRELQRVIYDKETRGLFAEELVARALVLPERSTDEVIFELLGWFAVCPDEARALAQQWSTMTTSPAFVRCLVAASLLFPTIAGDSVLRHFDRAGGDSTSDLAREAREFLRRFPWADEPPWLATLRQLRWFLVRSSGWYGVYDVLGQAIRNAATGAHSDLRAARSLFSSVVPDMIRPVERALGVLKNSDIWPVVGTLWHRETDGAIVSMRENAERLEAAISDDTRNLATAETSLAELDKARLTLVCQVETFMTNVPSTIRRVALRSVDAEQFEGLECTVDEIGDVPPALCTSDHVERIVLCLLDNAHKHGGGKVRFVVTGDEHSSRFVRITSRNAAGSTLIERSASDWDGGLASVREMSALYGGSFEGPRAAASVDGEEALIETTVQLPAWNQDVDVYHYSAKRDSQTETENGSNTSGGQ